ncbi:MAG: DUF4011 domain-containing anti-phage protein Hhe [Aeromonas veronii]|uniref:DUF4011 domain-containing anti-phage protein Hhe n=1 Tax=Aeromonas sp. 604443 TaxID=2712054 RepID=UPI003B9F0198
MSGSNPQTLNKLMDKVDPFVLSSLEAMRKKLLDLTSRNRLLNFPITQKGSSLRIVDELPDQLFETICAEKNMQFAPVPEPTREQLLAQGYLSVDEDGKDQQIKPHPKATEWAQVLGIRTDYDLPSTEGAKGPSEDDKALLLFAADVITQFAVAQNGKLTGIRAHYAEHNLTVRALTDASLRAGFSDLGEFELHVKKGEALTFSVSNPAHSDHQIQVMLYPNELEARLRAIHNKAQTAIEESGASILYLALGFLEWFESDDSDKARLAPLFTIPVMLERGKLDPLDGLYKFHLCYSGEDILPNLSLKEKLYADFGIALPVYEEEQTPEAYFAKVTGIIERAKPKWSVKRYAALSLLNFSKMMMFLDLDPDRWPQDKRNLVFHEVVTRFFTTQQSAESHGGGESRGGEYSIDYYPDIHNQIPLIDDADSSQHSALIDAMKGQHLVIEGPPGSGKSQTITNLIAAALLNGKKVLFVAEKMAALEVVKHRLSKAGLGDFCLELHSHKTHKRKVLEELQARMVHQTKMPSQEEIEARIVRYEELKEKLNRYAVLINQHWEATGKSIHQILSGATRYRDKVAIDPTMLHIDGLSGKNLDKAAQFRLHDQIVAFAQIYEEVREQVGESSEIYDHPWSGVCNTGIQLFDSPRIVEALKQWQAGLQNYHEHYLRFSERWSMADLPADLKGGKRLADDLSQLVCLSGQEHFVALPALATEACIKGIEEHLATFESIQACYAELKETIYPEKLGELAAGKHLGLPAGEIAKLGAHDSCSLRDLVRGLEQLHKLSSELDELDTQLVDLKMALPSVIANNMTADQSGFSFTAALLHLVSSLPAELIKWRDGCFDDDDIDGTLLALTQQIEELRPLRDNLVAIYQLDRLPSQEVLAKAVSIINSGNIFSWFKREWREARKLLLSLAVKPDAKFVELKRWGSQLVKFAERRQAFEQSGFDKRVGAAFAGIDTEVDQLTQLRAWYRQVRETYGVGFGPRVAIGSAVLVLDSMTIKGIQQLEKSSLSRRLWENIDAVLSQQQMMPTLFGSNSASNWLGKDGLLAQISCALKAILVQLQAWFVHDEITLGQMMQLSVTLRRLDGLQDEFERGAPKLSIFAGQVSLEAGLDKDNQSALASINATVAMARTLLERLYTPQLAARIRQLPDVTTYESLRQDGQALVKSWQQQQQSAGSFIQETQLDIELWFKSTDGSLEQVLHRNQKAIAQPRWLNGWLNFTRNREQMQAQGLHRIWEAVLQGRLLISQLEDGMQLAIYDQLSREVVASHPDLIHVSGNERNALQKTFREYDKKLMQLQRQRIAAKIAARHVPNGYAGGRKSEYTELALIQNELGKRMRHIPIRQLVNRAGHALQSLKPCFMMGPMSAAHYLEPGKLDFDLVVMDEASQVKPEDALGVIARGKQLIVVGDPKQLPPSSFFDRSNDDDDDDDDVAAVNQIGSILDAALPLFPMRRLRWHYRSQHESLIAYSNRHFYNNDLVIFPSPHADSPEFGIKFSYVPQGKFINQHNIEEARVVAEAVVRQAQINPKESLGIVAMSSKQRDQIERALDELRRTDAQADKAIEHLLSMPDPLFIKNLENVQGDERDVIFISFTYGPAEIGGKVYQRFGPINSDVGWRRLNVLFTRSKKRMEIFSSMRSDDVMTSETSKRGVLALKGFLHFAEKGALDGQTKHTGKAPDSDFEVAVIEAVNAAGFECEPQVGVAGFFVDIAVIDPGRPGRYLMGIECDGASYHSAKSARDRDRLRQEVLERLGWNIRRIWSTDWFSNPDEVLAPIIRELHELKSRDNVTEAGNRVTTPVHAVIDPKPVTAQAPMAEMDLKTSLQRFSKDVIAIEFPLVDEDRRLLRPAMLEALLEHQPLSRSEFVERIPKYLRDATEPMEAKRFLDQILALIDGSNEYSTKVDTIV